MNGQDHGKHKASICYSHTAGGKLAPARL